MSELPSSFSSNPNQEPYNYLKNLLIDFRKEVDGARDVDALQEKMQDIINAAKDMSYTTLKPKDVYSKNENEKAFDKLFTEFDRYIMTIQKEPSKAEDTDLLDALGEIQRLLENTNIS